MKENEQLKTNIKCIEKEKQSLQLMPSDNKFMKTRMIQNK